MYELHFSKIILQICIRRIDCEVLDLGNYITWCHNCLNNNFCFLNKGIPNLLKDCPVINGIAKKHNGRGFSRISVF